MVENNFKILSKIILPIILASQLVQASDENFLGSYHIASGITIISASILSLMYMPEICERHGEKFLGFMLVGGSLITMSLGVFEVSVGFKLILK